VKSRIKKNWKAISIDGSSFDSSQFAALMEETDNRFWTLMSGEVKRILAYNLEALSFKSERTLDDIHAVLMAALLQTRNIGFVNFPGVNAPNWTPEVRGLFGKHFSGKGCDAETGRKTNERPEDDWIAIDIEGTTFSGLSTRTTLGNTLRSICYMFWYIEEGVGITNPWDSDKLYVIASGDDTVVWIAPEYANTLKEAILRLTTRDKRPQIVGLGQCVVSVKVGAFWETEFCSKWSYSTGDLDEWWWCRDVTKTFTTKQHFSGNNAHMLRNPHLHRFAIYWGLAKE